MKAWNTDEARAVRRQRDEWSAMPDDPLLERARIVAYWKGRAAAEPQNLALRAHRGMWWLPFRTRPFQHLLMPGVRAMLQAQAREWDRQFFADLRAHSDRCWREKAMRKAPPMPLFSAVQVGQREAA